MANDAIIDAANQEPPETKPAGPCTMVIYGAAGDLTKRLVVPALYNLAASKLLPNEFAVVGVD
ncbi:MAG TPA: glucose-6-phosphate dehydrogenase, partial [Rhizobiaceae bacterium]|nr:glucose-6-phosphate dehydrogenase [Rhizobiaceae bacterium]